MDYRRLRPPDIPAILALQEVNLLGNGAPSPGGFLSARLGAEQFVACARDLAVIVAAADGDIAGYLCAAHDEPSRSIPILAAMLDELPCLSFLGRSLAAQRTFVYGPVCVADRWRGQGVLRGMYNALRREIAGDFDAGVLGEFNRSSQHLQSGGGDEQKDESEWSCEDAVTRATSSPASVGAATVLGGDRSWALERRGGRYGRGLAGGRNKMVSGVWRYAPITSIARIATSNRSVPVAG